MQLFLEPEHSENSSSWVSTISVSIWASERESRGFDCTTMERIIYCCIIPPRPYYVVWWCCHGDIFIQNGFLSISFYLSRSLAILCPQLNHSKQMATHLESGSARDFCQLKCSFSCRSRCALAHSLRLLWHNANKIDLTDHLESLS